MTNIPSKKQMNPISLILDEVTIKVTQPVAIIDNTVIILTEEEVKKVRSRLSSNTSGNIA